MNNIKISIIIPVYNVEKYLEECLNSVTKQTLKDIEIICVNDGSTDHSLVILEKFASKDNRIKILNKENGGYASAINTGLDAANGEFIQIVESDDYCALNMCELMYNEIKDSDADLITADFYFLRKDKLTVNNYFDDKDNVETKSFSLKTHPSIISKQAYPWKSLYRKAFLSTNNIKMIQDNNGAYEDQPWNATVLALASKILYLNKPLYFYRLDATGSSTNCGSKKLINYIKRKAQTKEILEKQGVYSNEVKEYYCNSAVGGTLFFFKRIDFKYKEEYYNEMKSFLKDVVDKEVTFKYFTKKNLKNYKNIIKKDYKTYNWLEILKHNIYRNFLKGRNN